MQIAYSAFDSLSGNCRFYIAYSLFIQLADLMS